MRQLHGESGRPVAGPDSRSVSVLAFKATLGLGIDAFRRLHPPSFRYDGWYGKVDLQRPKRSIGASKDDEQLPLSLQAVFQRVSRRRYRLLALRSTHLGG